MATASDTLPHDQSQPSRRRLMATLAAAPMAAAVPALAAEGEDPHVEWERQLPALRDAVAVAGRYPGPYAADVAADDAADAAVDRLWAVRDRICLTPARTPAGIAAQIRLAIESADDGASLTEQEEEGLRNAVRSLERLAGSA
jgi:hypothetical protein